jgi:hypothetical protein
MMDYLHYCWTHATTNPDHTSKSCSTNKLDVMDATITDKAGRQLHAASRRASGRSERKSATAAMDMEQPTEARDNEQEPLPRTNPPAPIGQSMPQWPTPP